MRWTLFAILFCACYDASLDGFACGADGTCPDGFACVQGECVAGDPVAPRPDAGPPAAKPTILSGPAPLTAQQQPSITYRVDGPAASTACVLDVTATSCAGTRNPDGSVTLTLPSLPDGTHRFTVIATDAAGQAAPTTLAWTLDTMPPQVTASAAPSCSSDWTINLVWSATDPSGLAGPAAYSAQDANGVHTTSGTCTTSPCSFDAPIDANVLDKQVVTIQLHIKDSLGNEGAAAAVIFTYSPLGGC
jgi:hypothetical protein